MTTARKSYTLSHATAWLTLGAVGVAVAIVILVLAALYLRMKLHPVDIAVVSFAAILAAFASFAIAALGLLVAVLATAAASTATGDVAAVRAQARAELTAVREDALASIGAAHDAAQSKTDTAAHFERLRFTHDFLESRDVREPAEWLDDLFLANGGDIHKVRDEVKRDLVHGSLDTMRHALAIYNMIAAISEYDYSNVIVHDIAMSRMAVRAQLAGYYFAPAFEALDVINNAAAQRVARFLADAAAYTHEQEPWVEQLIDASRPTFPAAAIAEGA